MRIREQDWKNTGPYNGGKRLGTNGGNEKAVLM